jgi:ATP-dependent Zn protease
VASHFFQKDHSHVRLSIRRRANPQIGEIGGYHKSLPAEEEWLEFRSQLAAQIRACLGSMACEHLFYGENTTGVTMDLIQATGIASRMVGIVGMGPDRLDPELSTKAVNIGEQLISVVQVTQGTHEQGTPAGAVLNSPRARRTVAQLLGSAYIDDWRLMYVNKEAIDLAAEALIAQGELVGDEISGLLDSVGMRVPTEADPYPEDMPAIPDHRPSVVPSAETA